MTTRMEALRGSANRLRELVAGLGPDDVAAPAYPSEWTIAQVCSHLGSGAVITQRMVADVTGGVEPSPDFNQSVWDEWNAKTPASQVADALVADAALLDAIEVLPDSKRAAFTFSMGPMSFDFDSFLGLRLNEHSLHVWDIAVVSDPTSTVAPDMVEFVIDNLDLMVKFGGKAIAEAKTVSIRTSAPRREFALTIGPDAVSMTTGASAGEPDLDISAEAFIRLVYGRLDPSHTPVVGGTADLDELRRVFPGR